MFLHMGIGNQRIASTLNYEKGLYSGVLQVTGVGSAIHMVKNEEKGVITFCAPFPSAKANG